MATPRNELIVPGHMVHALEIAPRLRPDDLIEARDLGKDPLDMAIQAMQTSPVARAWLVDGRVEAIFGISCRSFTSHNAEPWILATEFVERHPVRFLRGSLPVFGDMAASRYLHGFVHGQRLKSRRWLEWLGFEIGKPRLIGDALYLTFEMGRA